MPTLPLYRELQNNAPAGPGDGHLGLWFDRFFNQYDPHWKIIEADPRHEIEEGKKKWIETVAGKCGDGNALKDYVVRQANLCTTLAGETRAFKTEWHFATGLGNPHPVENGFAWHPTLGVPYLTGAAVKGLVRAWVECWMEFDDENERLTTLYRWFGSEDKDPKERTRLRKGGYSPPSRGKDLDTEAGAYIFFDAVPLQPVALACDIMTPHYGKWYEEGGKITNVDTEPEKIPADWHDPVPVPFLVAKAGTFLFSIAPRATEAKAAIDKVMDALESALNWLGAGAKTAVGYGTMVYDPGSEPADPFANFKSWFEAHKFSAANKGRHNEIIERLKQLPDIPAGNELVKGFMKKKECSNGLWAFLNKGE